MELCPPDVDAAVVLSDPWACLASASLGFIVALFQLCVASACGFGLAFASPGSARLWLGVASAWPSLGLARFRLSLPLLGIGAAWLHRRRPSFGLAWLGAASVVIVFGSAWAWLGVASAWLGLPWLRPGVGPAWLDVALVQVRLCLVRRWLGVAAAWFCAASVVIVFGVAWARLGVASAWLGVDWLRLALASA